MFAPFFFQGEAGPAPEPKAIIGNSLRFRGSQLLECNSFTDTSGNGEGTISLWVKLGKQATTVYPIHGGSNAGGSNLASDFGFTTSVPNVTISNPPELAFINSEGGAYTSYMSEPRFSARDPAGWYHLVLQWRRGVHLLCWVNGVLTPIQQPNWNSQSHEQNWGYMRGGAPTKLGVYGIGVTNYVQGMYVADVYGCDRKFYTADDFGKFNDDGVWVPINNPALGAPGGVYSNFLTAPTTIYLGQDESAVGAFDGNTSTGASTANPGPLTFAPEPPIVINQSLEVYVNMGGGGSITFDGTTISPTTSGGYTTVATSGTISSSNPLVITGDGSANAFLNAVKVDGQVLIDSTLYYSQLYTAPSSDTIPVNPTNKDFNDEQAQYAVYSAFNGDNSSGALSDEGSESWIQFRPNNTITAEESLVIRLSNTQTIAVNGIDTGLGQTSDTIGDVDLSSSVSFPLVLENVSIRGAALNNPRLCTLIVDGQELLNDSNPAYGPNGFHLQFADPNNIGRDTSGNGHNFTATGFDLSLPGIFSAGEKCGATGTYDPNPATRLEPWQKGAFNGNPDYQTQYGDTSTATGKYAYWTYPLTGVQSLRFQYQSPSLGIPTEVRVNGEIVAFTTGQTGPSGGSATTNWCDVTVPADGVVNELAWVQNEPYVTTAWQYELNGVVLTDNPGVNYDSMVDSPTQNYPTINPLNVTGPGYKPNTIDANLAANTSVSQADWASTCGISITKPSYFEGTFVTHCSIGVAEANVNNNSRCNLVAGSGTAYTQDNMGSQNNVPVGLSTLSAGTIGCRVDPDNRTVAWTYDGVTWSSNITYEAVDNPVMPYISVGAAQPTNTDLSINLGQQPFLFPVPAGYTPVQSQNIPQATIPNGRDYFVALQGAGNVATSSQLPAGYTARRLADGKQWSEETFVPGGKFPSVNPPYKAFNGLIDGGNAQSGNAATNPEVLTTAEIEFDFSGYDTTYTTLTMWLGKSDQSPQSGCFFVNGVDITSWVYANAPNIDPNMTYQPLDVGSQIPGNELKTLKIVNANQGNRVYSVAAIALDNEILMDYSILDAAQATFPKGLYWIKDIVNDNQWQFVSFMTGLGTTVYNTTGAANPTYPFSQGFDGDPNTATFPAPNTTNIITFPTPITGTTFTIKAFCPGNSFKVNGTLIPSQSSGTTVYDISALANGSLSSLEYSGGGSSQDGFYIITVDDQPVVGVGEGQALQCPSGAALTSYVPPTGNSIAYSWNSVSDSTLNTNGTTPSQVSADPKSGFSIVKWTGNDVAGATVGHGLNKAPEFMILKNYSVTESFPVYSKYLDATNPANYALFLNTTAAISSNTTYWNNTEPTDTVFSVGSANSTNGSGMSLVAYCWTSIPGFSAVGSFEGNNSTDGPFIYTGFETAFVMIKRLNNADHWTVRSVGIEPAINPMSYELNPDMTNPARKTSNNTDVDFLSNGFKIRSSDSRLNGSESYLYFAFATNPFGGDNTSPVTAY